MMVISSRAGWFPNENINTIKKASGADQSEVVDWPLHTLQSEW